MTSTEVPLRFGSDAQFAVVRDCLIESGYNAENICARLGVERLALFEGLQPRTEAWATKDALNLLISIFALGEQVRRDELFGVIPQDKLNAFSALGFLSDPGAEVISSPVSLGPVGKLFFVSDRWNSPDGSKFQIADDAVYPAITPNTMRFLDTVPQSRCEALLDVGTGTGVGALLGAVAYAKHAWAFDLTERSSKFTEFNCRLNGIANVTVGQGDLYAPAGDETFDRIIAHPPYVPVLQPHWAFHDGGDDGELITRRLVQGLPKYLRPGGLFHSYAMGSDREVPFEDRIRQWLGDSQSEFDVQVIIKNHLDPMQFAVQTVLKHEEENAGLGKWRELFERNRIKKLLFGTISVQRLRDKRSPFTARRVGGPRSRREEAEWLRATEARLARASSVDEVLSAHPVVAGALELVVHHVPEDGDFTPSKYSIRTEYPFVADADIPAWASVFLSRCRGEHTTRELLDEMKSEGYLQKQVPPHDFATLVASFIARGFVEIAEMPLPKRS